MSNVAIIPARGGSKRIARKNIKLFHGQPIIAYSIQAALTSSVFERVVVSTDDAEIAEIARRLGAEVPFMRPDALADDYAGTVEVIQHGLAALAAEGYVPDFACCIYATAPFVQSASLQAGLEILQARPDKEFAFSITGYGFPVQRAIRLNQQQCIESLYPQYYETRSHCKSLKVEFYPIQLQWLSCHEPTKIGGWPGCQKTDSRPLLFLGAMR